MNELKVFENPQFGKVRVKEIKGEPWFVAVDVCKALDLEDTGRATSRLDDDELTRIKIVSGGQGREVIAVNEPGLYSLVLGSRKPEAKAFKRWITHEVLPSIRKTGGYISGQEEMNDEEILSKALVVAHRIIDMKNKKIGDLKEKAELDKPKVRFADAVVTSKSSIMVGDLAKILKQNGVDIGQNRLFKWLRKNHYLCCKGELYNMPTQASMETGLFEIKETTTVNPDGSIRINKTPKVTSKGQFFFINKFLAGENS